MKSKQLETDHNLTLHTMNSNFSSALLTSDIPKDNYFQAGGPTMNTLLSVYDANTLRQLLLHAQKQQVSSSSSNMEPPASPHSTICSVLQQIANDAFNPQPIPEHHRHNNIDCNPIPLEQMPAGSQQSAVAAAASQFQQQAEGAGIHHYQHQEVAHINMGVFEPVPLSIQAAVECSIHQNHQTKKHELLNCTNSNPIMPPVKKQKLHETILRLDMTDDSSNSFRAYQAEQWSERFQELWAYCKQHGHCQVPHTHTQNPALARWVKRQRYQYKLKAEDKPSTMTDERITVLEKIGFVWDSHTASWEERMQELMDYRNQYGHCNVPSNYPCNRQLAVWVKRQRRQYKFFFGGKPSNMNQQRITTLETIGFEWELRVRESKSTSK
jgi:hypothetical protein